MGLPEIGSAVRFYGNTKMHIDELEAFVNHVMEVLRWGLTVIGVKKVVQEWQKDKADKKDNDNNK